MDIYAQRRAAFSRALGDAVAVIPSAPAATRNADTEFEFRQNADFYYLTGLNEPEAALVVAPNQATQRCVLFLRPSDREQEIWSGKRVGIDGATRDYGVDAAYPIAELSQRLADFLVGAKTLYYSIGTDEHFDPKVVAAVKEARWRVRRGGRAPGGGAARSLSEHGIQQPLGSRARCREESRERIVADRSRDARAVRGRCRRRE